MSTRRHDLTRPADLHHESFSGPLRRRRPEYVDLLPPCNDRCPAGENIQAWLAAAQAGHFREAWEILTRDNPMPAIHGRVCYHPCEDGCNRTVLDGPVSIHGVERFLGDKALEEGPVAACWSSAPVRAACRWPTTCGAWVTTSRSGRRGR
jgi:hypothetical protein